MRELNCDEIYEVAGAKFKLRVNLGAFLGGCALGFFTGGPIGLGYAIGAGIIAQSVNSLDDMYTNGAPYQEKFMKLNLSQMTLAVFLGMWVIGDIAGAPYNERMYWSVMMSICFAYFNNAHRIAFKKLKKVFS